MNSRWISLDDTDAWDEAIADIPIAIAHTHRFQAALAETTGDDVSLFVFDDGDGRAVCPFARRDKDGAPDLFTPYGFGGFTGAGDMSGLPGAFDAACADRGFVASYTLLHPALAPMSVPWGGAVERASTVYLMPICDDVERNLSRATIKRQRRVRRWRRRWSSIELEQTMLADAFVEMYPVHAERVGASATYRFSEATLRSLVDHPDAMLIGARSGGEIVSIALFGTTGPCADYLFLAQTDGGRAHSEGLLIEAFTELARRGVNFVNLGGGIHGDDGVAAFKRRFGALPLSGRALKHVFDDERYRALCRRHVATDTTFFPAYHAPPVALPEAA